MSLALNNEEVDFLKSQNVTLKKGRGQQQIPTLCFTERGEIFEGYWFRLKQSIALQDFEQKLPIVSK